MSTAASSVAPIEWHSDTLRLLDQRLLPDEEKWLTLNTVEQTFDAIRDMVVRGAPAIGVTAAYGVVLAAQQHIRADSNNWRQPLMASISYLAEARPTAINLHWALEQMRGVIETLEGDPLPALASAAVRIHADDLAANQRLGDLGAALIAPDSGVMTHCNAGALATSGYGTALGVVRSAWRDHRLAQVFATETRPWLQGARLTAWELIKDGIDVTLITDSAAAHTMASGRVQWVVTGADRIAANGDTANKIGTYALATLARAHGLKFMVAAPLSTIDRNASNGREIPIEHRDGDEITHLGGRRLAASGINTENPVFDVTPAHLIDALVTEKGVVTQPDTASIAALFER